MYKIRDKNKAALCPMSWYGKSITFKKKNTLLTICRQFSRLQIPKKFKQ